MTTTSISGGPSGIDVLRARAARLALVPHRAGRRIHALPRIAVRALLDPRQPAHRLRPELHRGLVLRARVVRQRAARLRDGLAFTATLALASAPMALLFVLAGSGLVAR